MPSLIVSESQNKNSSCYSIPPLIFAVKEDTQWLYSQQFNFKKKPCSTQGIPVSWVRLQKKNTHIHKQPDPEQLSVDHTHICSVRGSNLRHAARSAAVGHFATAPALSSILDNFNSKQ